VRDVLDEKLLAAAAASGRSVSEEIEFRLDQSFDRDAFIGLVLGGDENAKVLQTIAMVMKLESRHGHWLKDANTAETVRRAVNFIIGQFTRHYQLASPSEGVNVPTGWMSPEAVGPVLPFEQTPESLAYQALEKVRAGPAHTSFPIGTSVHTSIPSLYVPLGPRPKKSDDTPGNEGETK